MGGALHLTLTHHLLNELGCFSGTWDMQQGQAQLQHHKLLQSTEVLLTERSLLHQNYSMEVTIGLQQNYRN